MNKYLKTNVNGKVIECGIGIDYGKVLVTQVGMYGLEVMKIERTKWIVYGLVIQQIMQANIQI